MPDFLVLKLAAATSGVPPNPSNGLAQGQPQELGSLGSNAGDWQPVLIALGVDSEEAAAKQAYSGEGTYKVLPWDDDAEVVVMPGEPEVTMVSKAAVAEELAAAKATVK